MEKELFTTPDLKSRGWTDSLVRRFLEVPDDTRSNPKYRNAGSPMKLYLRDRVSKIETSMEFMDAKRKADARKISAKKAVETKLAQMTNYIKNLTIEVPEMERTKLIEAANENFRSLDLPSEVRLSDERMCVNFLRHCGTKYETELRSIAGKTGAVDAYFKIKDMVLEKIAFTYDWLAEECDRQRGKMNKERSESW